MEDPAHDSQTFGVTSTLNRETMVEAVHGLIGRLCPGHDDTFELEWIPPTEGGYDVFEVQARGDKVVLRGNTGVSLAAGLRHYLEHSCHCHVSLCGNQLNWNHAEHDMPATPQGDTIEVAQRLLDKYRDRLMEPMPAVLEHGQNPGNELETGL